MWLLLMTHALAAPLQVHLVAHTHDDVGWLKTVDEYYYGLNNTIYTAGVQYILDSVILALEADPSRKFVYVEMAFLFRWWNEQSEDMKTRVRTLVNEGRLQFINGGWCMHDEATPYYEDMIDNMAVGHAFLLSEFNYRPTVAWQIDPFGHSAANADLYAKMGFNALLFGRIDYQDQENRMANRTMEMVWRPSISTGSPADIFAGVLYHVYWWPPYFCLDINCEDDPIVDDPRFEGYNIITKAQDFADYIATQGTHYLTNHVLVTMGSDFNYQNAFFNFKNIDKLIDYINARPQQFNMTLFYSTPVDYVDALYATGQVWPLKTDDFFPYADDPVSYWTGYFTSRPTFKRYVRWHGDRLRALEALMTDLSLKGELSSQNVSMAREEIDIYRQKVAITQHHDAVSGTEKQHVTFDYERELSAGQNATDSFMYQFVSMRAESEIGENLTFGSCPFLNQSYCEYLENPSTIPVVSVYNPSFMHAREVIALPVNNPSDDFAIVDELNNFVLTDLIDQNFTGKVFASSRPYVAYFEVDVPPRSTRYFKLVNSGSPNPQFAKTFQPCDECLLDNSEYLLNISSSGWELTRFDLSLTIDFNMTLGYYIGADPQDNVTPSGAYIFSPNQTLTNDPLPYYKNKTVSYLDGEVIQQLLVNYDDTNFQVVTLTNRRASPSIHIKHYINSIPIDDGTGKEIVTLYGSDLDNQGVFYTDSNSMKVLERRWNFRPTWNLNYTNQPKSCNYYPVTSTIYYQNGTSRLTLVTDRSQGGTVAQYENQTFVELMVHRRLLFDDYRGLDEALNETESSGVGLKVIAEHYMILNSNDQEQLYVQRRVQEPLQLYFAYSSISEFKQSKHSSPPVVSENFKVALRSLGSDSYIVRVEAWFKAANFDMSAFLGQFADDFSVSELSLSENQLMENVVLNHYDWKTTSKAPPKVNNDYGSVYAFNLRQVRVFVAVLDVPTA